PLPSAPETRIYIQKVEHYHAMGGPVMTAARKTEPAIQGPWFSGLFYLVSLILLMALLAAIGKLLPWWALPVVVIGGLLSVTVVGALQLKQDQRLSEQGFLKLMALAFRQLPLLKQVLRKEEKPAEDHGEG